MIQILFFISLTGVSCFFSVALVCYSQHQLFRVYCTWLCSCFI